MIDDQEIEGPIMWGDVLLPTVSPIIPIRPHVGHHHRLTRSHYGSPQYQVEDGGAVLGQTSEEASR